MNIRLYNLFSKSIAIILSFLMLIVTILLLFFQKKIDYMHKVNFLYSNFVLFIIGIFLLIIFVIIYNKFKKKIDIFFDRIPNWIIIVLSITLFLIQSFIFYHTYFITGWDSQIVVETANAINLGKKLDLYQQYLSIYPNNLMMTWIYFILFRINSLLNLFANSVYFVIVFQCFLSCIGGYFLFSIIKNNSKNSYAYFSWIIYAIHIALNPWISILYSDPLVLCVPLFIIWLYDKQKNNKNSLLKWGLIGFVSYFGFKIKPQVLIVLIAIIIVDILNLLLKCNKKELINKMKNYTVMGIGCILGIMLWTIFIFPSLKLNIDNDSKMTISHFIMMGLNSETNGSYSLDDVTYSKRYKNIDERKEMNYRVINERLKQFGVSGLLKHLVKKCLVVYGDGTYAWMQEGNFFAHEFGEHNKVISPFLKSIYYGDNYQYFATFEHIIWLTLIIGSGGIFLYFHYQKKINPIILIITLSVIGLFMFEMIFEVRARYLFIYIPFYIIIALYGWMGIFKTIKIISKKRL